MRLGQILIEADLISAKQLSNGLEYGQGKGIALGRVLKLLKVMKEADIERALHAQKLIRMGLSPNLALEALKKAVKEQRPLEDALHSKHLESLSAEADAVAVPVKSDSAAKKEADFLEIDYAASVEELLKVGDKLLLIDDCAGAESNYLHARKVLEKRLGRNHVDLCPILNRLGNTFMATERFEDAEECYEEVLVLRIRAFAPDDPQVAQAYESLADLNKAREDEEQAMENFRFALDILEKKLPAQLGLYASILRKIAAYSEKKKQEEPRKQPIGELLKAAGLLSETQMQDALKTSKQSREPVGAVLRKSGMVCERDFQSALKAQFYVRQAVLTEELAADLLARASRRAISLERLLHEANILASDESRFETYREIAVALDQLVSAESSKEGAEEEMALIAHKVARLYEQVGDQHQAEIYYSRALKVWSKELKCDLNVAATFSSLAKLKISQGRFAEAQPLLMKALELRQSSLGAQHEDTIETLEDIAELELEYQGNAAGAMNFLNSAFLSRQALGHVDGQLFRAVALQADCYAEMGNFSNAESLYMKAVEHAQAGFGSASPALAAVSEKLGNLYLKQEEFKKSAAQFEYAMRILKVAGKLEDAKSESLKEKIEKAKNAGNALAG